MTLTPNKYQEAALSTEIYTQAGREFIHELGINPDAHPKHLKMLSLMYCTGKLNGEAGELAEIIFKAFRGGGLTNEQQTKAFKELGDVLWYCATIANLLGFYLEDVMEANIYKLKDRKDRGVIHGYGDDR